MTRKQLLFALSSALLLLSMVCGGGPESPLISGFIEIIGCALIGLAIVGLCNDECPRNAYPALVLIVLIVAVPMLHLIPLPAGVWRSLPGRDMPDRISQLAGQGLLPRPLSLSPEDTRMHALALIVPAAMFLATLQLDARSRDRIITLIVVLAFASAILGAFQVVIGAQLYFFEDTHLGFPVGFFANRNHEGDLMVIAIPLSVRAIAAMKLRRDLQQIARLALIMFFCVAVIATQSRSALGLLPVGLLGAVVVYEGALGGRRFWLSAAGLVVLTIFGAAMLQFTPIGARVLARFNEVGSDLRPEVWKASLVAIREYWPFGSGVGSFVPVYMIVEDLNFVRDTWMNHAHNDYLELVIEAGASAIVLITFYFVLLVLRVVASSPRWLGFQKWAAISGIAILLLHSITDYPLRTFGLLAIFAFLNALLFPSKESLRVRHERVHPVDPQPSFLRSTDGVAI